MPEGQNQSWYRLLAQSHDEVRALHQMCREGRLYDVERWIAEGKPLQLAPDAIPKGTRPKTALQIALEGGQHSLAFLLLSNGYRLGDLGGNGIGLFACRGLRTSATNEIEKQSGIHKSPYTPSQILVGLQGLVPELRIKRWASVFL